MTPHQFMNFAQDFNAKRRKDEQWLRHKSQYNNANYDDFSRNYDAVINNQTKPDDWVKNYAFGNSLTAGITDTAATWLAGGARLLGLNDAANKLDNVKQQIRIHQDVHRGDSGFSNFVYGAGTIAPELLLPAGQIKLGAGLLKNARNAAGWGAATGGLTSALDSDKSWGQAGWDTFYGGVGGGLLGGIGSSVMGKLNGYGWSNSGGLLDRAKGITNSGGGLLDSEIAKGIREEMGIQRPTHWQTTAPQQQASMVGQSHWYPNAQAQMNPNTTDDLGISEPKFYVPNGLKDPTLAAIDNDLAQELMQKLNDLKLRGQLTEQATDALLKEAFAKGERVAQPQMSVKAPKEQIAIQQIPAHEEAQLRKEFAFKDNKPLQRELTHSAIAHALKQHGNPEIESSRGQIAITLDDIKEYYPAITQNYDYRAPTNNNAIVYAKQINGHFITIEEVIQNGKLRFKTAWKTKGNFNQQQVFRNAQYVENRSQIGNPRPADITATQAEYSSKATPETLADNVNPTTSPLNNPLDDTQMSLRTSNASAAINNVNSPSGLADEHVRLPRSARNDAIDPNFAPQSSLRGREDEAINNIGSPTREIAAPAMQARNDAMGNGIGANMMSRLTNQAASNAVAGTAGGIANVALDDSDDALALKFAKGFAYGVMGKVAAKHGMPAATKAGKAAFDYALKQTTELRTLWRENPQLWTRFLNKQLTDDFAQFGGQKAGLHAERFAVAQTLANKGVGETEILERTGWFKGLDGNWKFQIDLSNGAAYKLREGTYSLVQLFKQPSLYQAYPFLKKMRVSIQPMPENVNGYFDMPTMTINLNSVNNKFDFTQALSHEVQHIIQQYEGFAVGTSKKDKNYWTNAGEVEARATFKGGENNPQQRLNNELEEGRLIQEFEKQAPQSSLRTSNASAAINNQDSPNGLGQTESAIAAPAMQARNDAMGANNVAHSQKLEDSYLNKATQRIDTEALNKHAIPLPKPLSQHEFMAQAKTDAQGIARVQTPIGEVKVDMQRAWGHINGDNTHNQDRTLFSGAFLDTISDPLAIIRQKYYPTKPANGESMVAQDSYVFFKPYKDPSGSKYLAAFFVDKNGELLHKTFFDPSLSKINKWIQSHNDDLLYYKFDPQSSLRGREDEAINNANSPNGLGNETLVQQIQTKFKFDEAKARDLAQWHKDSHPVTKEKDGTPKVFYHGSGDDFGFEVFKPSAADEVEAIYFSTSEKVAKSYEQMGYRNSGIYKCFLNIKNPLVLDFKKESYNSEKYAKALYQAKANGNDGVIIKNVYDDTGGYYDSKGDFKDIPSAHTYIIFDSKQIKEINNRGIEGKYFNESSPNIYESVRKPTTDNQHHTQKLDISGLTINLREMSADERKAFVAQLDLRANAEHVPAKMSEEEFRNSAVKYAKNKPNFLAHIKSRDDAEARMKLLNLVEPTIEHFHYKVVNGDVERFIKTFSYEKESKKELFSLVVTKHNKETLITFIPIKDEHYIRKVISEGEQVVGGRVSASFAEGSKALSTKQGKTTDSQGISSDLLPDDTQYSLKNPLKDLRNAAARIEGIKAFAKYVANPPEHLRADAQRLRADKAAMAELDMHTRKAATDKANAIDELAYQMGYPEPQYSMKNPRQKQKFKEDSVGLVEQIRSSSKAFADKILNSKWVDVPLGTRIYTKGFEDYRGIKDSFDRDIAANTSNALDLHNKLKLLSEDTQRKMYQYMSGDLKGEELSKDIRELADEFRKVVRKETDELVKLGLLNEETAKKWGDIYIMREYSPRVSERIKRVLNGGRSEDYGIGLDSIHMRGKKEKVSVEKYQEMLENGEIGDITKGKWEVLHKPTKHEPKYILRRDYTKAEREKMGEIELISTALPRTLAKLQNQKRIATFFDALSKNSDLAFKLEKNQEIPSGFRQLRGEQFGALRGFAVRNEVADDIERTTNRVLGESKEVLAMAAKLATFWKKTKTIHNPTSHINNMIGNVFFMLMEGEYKGIKYATQGIAQAATIRRYEELLAKQKVVPLSANAKCLMF